MAVVAALQLAREADPSSVIVVLLPDGGRGYLTKIFDDDWLARFGFLGRSDGNERLVGDVLKEKSGALPALVHTHPHETIADAIAIMREYGVSQMPVVRAEPPVMAAEVVGSVSERTLLEALFSGSARLPDAVGASMDEPLPSLGAGEPVSAAVEILTGADALMVLEEGRPAGVLTRQDLLSDVGARR
jgi:cystathionine beta-synthase